MKSLCVTLLIHWFISTLFGFGKLLNLDIRMSNQPSLLQGAQKGTLKILQRSDKKSCHMAALAFWL